MSLKMQPRYQTPLLRTFPLFHYLSSFLTLKIGHADHLENNVRFKMQRCLEKVQKCCPTFHAEENKSGILISRFHCPFCQLE